MTAMPLVPVKDTTLTSGCSSAWLERYVRDVEVAGSNPVTPTFFRIKPFGEYVKGLSHFYVKTYVV
jgi:hypothetical protein